jgi:polysaccharide export outer membrane protein
MPSSQRKWILISLLLLRWPAVSSAQQPADQSVPQPSNSTPVIQHPSAYVLGADDQITIQALEAEEISNKPVRIDADGYITLPLLGRVHAGGLTVGQLEAEMTARLKTYIQEPQVSVNITEFRSQPVSVIGQVKNPGVQQLQGRKTLVEVLSLAGGLQPDAGHSVKITRRPEWGPIPLPNATKEPGGNFSIAEVSLKRIMEAKNPEENILIQPNDVISVPRAEMVYVIGEVKKPGGFILSDRKTVSVLQALSLAEGLELNASAKNAKIIRESATSNRTEIPLNLKDVLAGKSTDIPMYPDDILFVPNSSARTILGKTAEAALRMGTGIAIYSSRY